MTTGPPEPWVVEVTRGPFVDWKKLNERAREVTRRIARQDGRTELCFRFVDVHEKIQDQIRRHVFAGLRTLRARGML